MVIIGQRIAKFFLFRGRERRQHIIRRRRGQQIELLVIQLILAHLPSFYRTDEKILQVADGKIHRQHAQPVVLIVQGNRGRNHLRLRISVFLLSGLPKDPSPRIITLGLPHKPC